MITTLTEQLGPTPRVLVEYNTAGDPVYIGHAPSGTPSGRPAWYIKKIEYETVDAITHPVRVGYVTGEGAGGNARWTDRASYIYG